MSADVGLAYEQGKELGASGLKRSAWACVPTRVRKFNNGRTLDFRPPLLGVVRIPSYSCVDSRHRITSYKAGQQKAVNHDPALGERGSVLDEASLWGHFGTRDHKNQGSGWWITRQGPS